MVEMDTSPYLKGGMKETFMISIFQNASENIHDNCKGEGGKRTILPDASCCAYKKSWDLPLMRIE